MTISRSVTESLVAASWIRRMFEQGIRMKREFGSEAVADLSLGNPVQEPPEEVLQRLRAVASDLTPGIHRYMPNAGLPETREAVAGHLRGLTDVPYGPEHIVMTVGAGGGLNVVLKVLLDPDDEVIVLAPFFAEYVHYIANFGAKTIVVETDDRFRPDPELLAASITRRTRAVLVNSPNNPSGVIYSAEDLAAIGQVLEAASARQGRPVYLISDEPYRALAYDGVEVPWPVHHYRDSIHVTSFSKDLSMPGERIGYVAVNPASEGTDELHRAMNFAMRALGFVNAPALQQRLVTGLLDLRPATEIYARTRARILEALTDAGYEYVRPDGAFYVFPKVPGDGDDVAFVAACIEERLLVVPGRGFGRAGHFRISYAVEDRSIDLAVGALARVRARYP